MAKPLTVFCDFDGTITERDMIVTLCEKFCPPGWERVKDDILSRKKSVKVGVAELFAMIPSSRKNDLIRYGQEIVRWRAGFQAFLEFCKTNGLRFIVCSGGIDFFVEPLMAPYKAWIDKIYSIPGDFSGPTIALRHPYGCETDGLCKVKVMAEYPDSIHLLIGDSITDLHGAQHANLVYARNGLKDYLDQEKVSYTPFETFFDVIKSLESFQGTPCPPHPIPPEKAS
jgi:2-hydroxy-3-keto-5-methylthiopentenyl-1-phosphate phosphatase